MSHWTNREIIAFIIVVFILLLAVWKTYPWQILDFFPEGSEEQSGPGMLRVFDNFGNILHEWHITELPFLEGDTILATTDEDESLSIPLTKDQSIEYTVDHFDREKTTDGLHELHITAKNNERIMHVRFSKKM